MPNKQPLAIWRETAVDAARFDIDARGHIDPRCAAVLCNVQFGPAINMTAKDQRASVSGNASAALLPRIRLNKLDGLGARVQECGLPVAFGGVRGDCDDLAVC